MLLDKMRGVDTSTWSYKKWLFFIIFYLIYFVIAVKLNLVLLFSLNPLEWVLGPSTARTAQFSVMDTVIKSYEFDPSLEWTFLDSLRFKFLKIIFFNLDMMDMFIINLKKTYEFETGMPLKLKHFVSMTDFQCFIVECFTDGSISNPTIYIENICMCYRVCPGKKFMVFQIIVFEGFLAIVQDSEFEYLYSRNYPEVINTFVTNEEYYHNFQYSIARLSDREIMQLEKELNDEAISYDI